MSYFRELLSLLLVIIISDCLKSNQYLLILNLFVNLIQYKTSVLMYKVNYKLSPNTIQRFFYSNEDSLHNTGQRDQ